MANREALRELQSRLASRLQAARTEGCRASWLAVEAAGAPLPVSAEPVGRDFPWASAQPVPYTQPWFLGVANLRGGLYGVVDLASFVGVAAPGMRSDLARSESRLVALNALLDINCALLIDRLAGLRNAGGVSSSSEPPEGRRLFRPASPMPMVRTGRKSTCRRCRNNPNS
jgi:twitching motility protein PilI